MYIMVELDFFDDETKERVLGTWKKMKEEDKGHFINQVSLALSIWGSDERGKMLVLEILKHMIMNGSMNLADFGLYINKMQAHRIAADRKTKVKRVATIVDGYRIRNSLPPFPQKEEWL